MKVWYDKNARNRSFKPGYKVLVFLPISGHPLQARYYGPYEIESKISDVINVVSTPERQKQKQMCHINMLKEYHERCDRNLVKPVSALANVKKVQNCIESDMGIDINEKDCNQSARLQNSTIFADFDTKVGHLSIHQKEQV